MSQDSLSTVYIKHSDLPEIDIKQLPLILCEAVNEIIPGNVNGAQLISGIWSVWLVSLEAKNYLIEGNFSLTIGNHRIFIYGEYPVIVRRPPTEKVLFKNVPFHVSDDELLKYMYSSPDMYVHTKRIIPARLRNKKRELTPYLSGDRFLYVRGDFRRVLPSMISISNHKCRVIHQSQELACRRYRFLGHTANNTAVCDAFCDDPNVIAIRSPKNPLSNYYICDVTIYGKTFKSAEHAFQWRLCDHVNREELSQEILKSPTPEQAKEVASRVPPHLRGTWQEIKCETMEQNQFQWNKIKSDIFWSSGLNPSEATTTKPSYYPGLNRLGYILERIRSKLLLRRTSRESNELTHILEVEKSKCSVTLTDSPDPTNINPMLSASSSSLAQHPELTPSSSTQSITPTCSTTISAPPSIETMTSKYFIISNVSSSTLASSPSPVASTSSTVSNSISSTFPPCEVDPVATSSNKVQIPYTEKSHVTQPSASTITKAHSSHPKKRVQQKSSKPKNQSRI